MKTRQSQRLEKESSKIEKKTQISNILKAVAIYEVGERIRINRAEQSLLVAGAKVLTGQRPTLDLLDRLAEIQSLFQEKRNECAYLNIKMAVETLIDDDAIKTGLNDVMEKYLLKQ